MKQITIKVPDNYELKQDGNTYTIVGKEKKLTYRGVAAKLFFDEDCTVYINSIGKVIAGGTYYENSNNCTSVKQAEKLLAINKLMNVAKYLNGDWQPDWHDYKECKYYIYYDNSHSKLRIECNSSYQNNFVYFKLVKFAKQGIEILGEETIKLALCTDY